LTAMSFGPFVSHTHTLVANLSGATITSFSFPLFRFSFLRLKFLIQLIAKHNFDLVKKHENIFGEEFYYAIDLILLNS